MAKALVLGGGGVAGIAWEAGVVTGLLRAGVDVRDADVIIGTSAGSVVGTLIATGAELEGIVGDLATSEADASAPQVDWEPVMAAFGVLYDPSLEPAEARRRVGKMALGVTDGADRLRAVGERLPVQEWPERALRITAVDVETGELKVWDRESGAPLVLAVASSCAVPLVFPPVEIDGRHYMDGGVRSVANIDLAAGADAVVILEPMASMSPRSVFDAEIAELGEAAVAHVAPDENSIAVFGANVLDPALWQPAFEAGLAQAESAAEAVAKVWRG